MITLYPYEKLGHANHGWLNTRHHFSFANYYNPKRMGFGVLRVINDDIIQAGKGFDTHPHRDMEIITYVRQGAITHRDNQGNEGRTVAGNVQVMSAGTGVAHSEFNAESEETIIYQIWIEPKAKGIQPDWDSHEFPKEANNDALTLLASGDGEAPLYIHQNAAIYAGNISEGHSLTHSLSQQAYILISKGEVTLEGQNIKAGDGAEITEQDSLTLHADSDTELLVIEIPNH